MAYQYVREPLMAEEADRIANACKTPQHELRQRLLLIFATVEPKPFQAYAWRICSLISNGTPDASFAAHSA